MGKKADPSVTIRKGDIRPGKVIFKDAFLGEADFSVSGTVDGRVEGTIFWVLHGTQIRIQGLKVCVEIPDGNVTNPDYKSAVPFKLMRRALSERLFSEDGHFLSEAAWLQYHGFEGKTEAETQFLEEQAERAKQVARFLTPGRPARGRYANNDQHWAWVAARYEYGARVFRAPIVYLQDEFAKEEIFYTEEQVKGQVEQATRAGFISRPSGKGHIDRKLTQKFHDYMEKRRKEEEE